MHTPGDRPSYLHSISHKRIDPPPLTADSPLPQLIEEAFLSYNAGRLREACRLFAMKMLADDTTVGLSLSGALTPAGLGMAAIITLIESGFVDWIISTGANLYHDTHFGLGLAMHRGNAQESDVVLREEGVVRIYDIFFDYDVLLSTDAFFRPIIQGKEFQRAVAIDHSRSAFGRSTVMRNVVLSTASSFVTPSRSAALTLESICR